MMADTLHFVLPQAASLLFLVPIFLIFFWILFSLKKNFQQQFLPHLLINTPSIALYWVKTFSFCLAWIFASIALMQPYGNERYPEAEKLKTSSSNSSKVESLKGSVRQRKAHDVILLIDVSASMSVTDARENLSRLDFAKEIADELIRDLTGENVALYSFTSEAQELAPLTSDYLFARLMLRQLNINEGGSSGTDLAKPLQQIRERYFEKPNERLKTLILLSDGEDNRVEIATRNDAEKAVDEIVKLVADASSHHLRLFTIGLGTEKGQEIPNLLYQNKQVISHLNEELLKKLAEQGFGKFFLANQFSAPEIAQTLIDQISQATTVNAEANPPSPIIWRGQKRPCA